MLLFFNNNILTQSIIFLPVFSSKYVRSRIRNIFPIQKKQPMIRILAQAFNYENIFSKSKINMNEDKKKLWNGKRLGFRSDSICRVEIDVSHMRS